MGGAIAGGQAPENPGDFMELAAFALRIVSTIIDYGISSWQKIKTPKCSPSKSKLMMW